MCGTGHLHDDVILVVVVVVVVVVVLLLLPESFRVLLSYANEGFCYLDPLGLPNLYMKGKTKRILVRGSSKMTPSFKWPLVQLTRRSLLVCYGKMHSRIVDYESICCISCLLTGTLIR